MVVAYTVTTVPWHLEVSVAGELVQSRAWSRRAAFMSPLRSWLAVSSWTVSAHLSAWWVEELSMEPGAPAGYVCLFCDHNHNCSATIIICHRLWLIELGLSDRGHSYKLKRPREAWLGLKSSLQNTGNSECSHGAFKICIWETLLIYTWVRPSREPAHVRVTFPASGSWFVTPD